MVEQDIPAERFTSPTFWENFEGHGVIIYRVEGAEVDHVVVVRSAGIVFDPAHTAPEEGEPIEKHFEHYQRYQRSVAIHSFYRVVRP
jgi:hypothetical protein